MLYHLKLAKTAQYIFVALLLCTAATNQVFAQTISNVIGNAQTQAKGLPKFIYGILYIMGVFFLVRGSYGLYEFGKDAKATWTKAVATMGLGVFLITLPTIYQWTIKTWLTNGTAATPAMPTIGAGDLSVFNKL